MSAVTHVSKNSVVNERSFQIRVLLVLFSFFVSTAAFADCKNWVARMASVQGKVEVQDAASKEWKTAKLNDTYCQGDLLRVGARSRAALELHNKTVLRLNEQSTLLLSGPRKDVSWVDLMKGSIHAITRVPKSLKIKTPYVNAAVEGTEFIVRVDLASSSVSVVEGKVLVSNQYGKILLSKNESALANKGEAPKILKFDIKPLDSVHWSLYYPRLNIPKLEHIEDLIAVGQVDQALSELKGNKSAEALSLRSIIAVVKNNKNEALSYSLQALRLNPRLAAAYLARSYALQANFDLEGAAVTAKEAVFHEPGNVAALTRLAEMQLAMGELSLGLASAQSAAEIDPELARAKTLIGFARLLRHEVVLAVNVFNEAIKIDSADPLARLGLGLARVRQGSLEFGRRNMEVATVLDTGNALIRSYLGKTYFEEDRGSLASDQFFLSQELDPNDPTPWFYDALKKQSENNPIGAVTDLQRSKELNENRAVYRSKQSLDSDAAARSSSIARAYTDVGFEQDALQSGWNALNIDPANHSAHRFLADTYSTLPRHQIARVSELLQAQLLQPLNTNPVQPQLAESNLGILDGAGTSDASTTEFNSLFTQDGDRFQFNAVGGANSTFGDDLLVSGLHGSVAYSIGQFHYESDGFRANNDLTQDIYNIFVQKDISGSTSLQAEYRDQDSESGDLTVLFDPLDFSENTRNERSNRLARVGVHHKPSSRSDILFSYIRKDLDYNQTTAVHTETTDPFLVISDDLVVNTISSKSSNAEFQYLLNTAATKYVAGLGYFDEDRRDTDFDSESVFAPDFQDEPFVESTFEAEDLDSQYKNAYLYVNADTLMGATYTIGFSYDRLSGRLYDTDKFNPKLGFTWPINKDTKLRLAYLKGLARPINGEQTIEPTQVAGFNQFFDDIAGSETERYGMALEHRFNSRLSSGVEFSKRNIDAPISGVGLETVVDPRSEKLHRAYLYWTPIKRLALSGEYLYESQNREIVAPKRLKTKRIPLGVSYYWPKNVFVKAKSTYVDQTITGSTSSDDDSFWIVDASVGYRLDRRKGLVQLKIKNLLDKEFSYFDTAFQSLARGPVNPVYVPERQLFVQFSYVFQ